MGTVNGSNSVTLEASMGTQTRPVPGCTQKGDLSKWLRCLETSESRRGYVYSKMISCLASLRSLVSSFYEGPDEFLDLMYQWITGSGKNLPNMFLQLNQYPPTCCG